MDHSSSRRLSTRSGKARKLVIKGLKGKAGRQESVLDHHVPTLPESFEEEAWARISRAIHAIHTQIPLSDVKEGLYRLCESLCQHHLGVRLYHRVKEQQIQHAQQVGQELRAHAQMTPSPSSKAWLTHLQDIWKTYCRKVLAIRDILLPMDRTVPGEEEKGLCPVWDMGLEAFTSHSFTSCASRTEEALVDLLDQARGTLNHESIKNHVDCMGGSTFPPEKDEEDLDRDELIHQTIGMYRDMNLFHSSLEPTLIRTTKAYYLQEGKACFRSPSTLRPIFLLFSKPLGSPEGLIRPAIVKVLGSSYSSSLIGK
ncbi:Cullin repeat-like-containing domain protein [Piptocephalis cylindrospora]|uniref:Cullin repeat-like-containing domain protein n=1 Tax=Piptocephalis cylindrospora TaxID=1907219 RepID=A0A4P9Y0D6_9FUNG|nr:Cullin repeat-like-containing domain protein [Piptocephalis cylindrospora]|eukprot:RKP12246.1 Cullin repeat-like-containing domain protein [Piptocephalis cylindrospora]